MNILKPVIALTFALLHLVVCIQGRGAGIQDLLGRETQPVVTSSISSTAAGGPWSAPSTWIGGVVPGAGDDVTITPGATVIIDTTASANSVIVGGPGSLGGGVKTAFTEGASPAVLRFGDTGPFWLTVTGDVTIGSNDSFTTGGGNGNQHLLTVGGDLTNNGVLDFSTNNNMAAASITFTGASNNTFGGSGPITDISWLTIEKGTTSANILELSAANFSVRGSVADTPDSGFLFLNHGTFKISGTFTLSNRTFFTTPYEIANDAGFWLNNPNYTIAAQSQAEVEVWGTLRVTAGTYNVGTDLNDSLVYRPGSTVIVEGGEINIAGRFAIKSDGSVITTFSQSGGTITTCKVGTLPLLGSACIDLGSYVTRFELSLTGGEIVVQTGSAQSTCPCPVHYYFAGYPSILYSETTIRFGNAETAGPQYYIVGGNMPNVAVDTTAGGHTILGLASRLHSLNIGPGGIWDTRDDFLMITGDTINDGTIKASTSNSNISFIGTDQTYSGAGGFDGPIEDLELKCHTLTLNPVNNIRVLGEFEFYQPCLVINSGKITLGNNDDRIATVAFWDLASVSAGFDSPPVFELGTGGQRVVYSTLTPRTTGFEINPDRKLRHLNFMLPSMTNNPCGLTVAGGDLTVTDLSLANGIICAGPNRIIHKGGVARQTGYINGTVVREFTAPGTYTFPIGLNGYSPMTVNASAIGTVPSYLSVKIVDTTLPGLLPANSASRYWQLEETGDITAGIGFTYNDADVRGSEPNYALWRNTGGPPVMIAGSVPLPNSNTVSSPAGVTEFTGSWGIGGQLDPGPVSISGSVTTAGGQPIRNAVLTISGGNLPAPVTVQTGNFGTYSFGSLQAGEAYTVRVDVKRYRFAQPTQLVTPMSNVSNVNFVANPQE
jgi:hypothetical protein